VATTTLLPGTEFYVIDDFDKTLSVQDKLFRVLNCYKANRQDVPNTVLVHPDFGFSGSTELPGVFVGKDRRVPRNVFLVGVGL